MVVLGRLQRGPDCPAFEGTYIWVDAPFPATQSLYYVVTQSGGRLSGQHCCLRAVESFCVRQGVLNRSPYPLK